MTECEVQIRAVSQFGGQLLTRIPVESAPGLEGGAAECGPPLLEGARRSNGLDVAESAWRPGIGCGVSRRHIICMYVSYCVSQLPRPMSADQQQHKNGTSRRPHTIAHYKSRPAAAAETGGRPKGERGRKQNTEKAVQRSAKAADDVFKTRVRPNIMNSQCVKVQAEAEQSKPLAQFVQHRVHGTGGRPLGAGRGPRRAEAGRGAGPRWEQVAAEVGVRLAGQRHVRVEREATVLGLRVLLQDMNLF